MQDTHPSFCLNESLNHTVNSSLRNSFAISFVHSDRRFVCRCQANTFGIVNRLFKENQEGRSVIVQLVPHCEQLKEVQEAGLPTVLTLRFITVRLKTGELEILATNLLDEELYPTECFGELYHHRWGVETY